MKKYVLLPIEVPENEYCWDGYVCCEHFENPGGHPNCILNLDCYEDDLDYDKEGKVPKPRKCLLLVNALKKQNERI
jgi:hypothetical protein